MIDVPATALEGAPGGAPGLDDTYPAVPRSVGTARTAVSAWLRADGVSDTTIGDIALAVSEACTNAVVHAYRDPIVANGVAVSFRLVAVSDGPSVRVTVCDDGAGMMPRADSPGLGLGLPVIAALTERLEVSPAPGGRGTVVSMLFAAPRA